MTTASGEATPCIRAARFGVSPIAVYCKESLIPMRSPMTTRPVAMPMLGARIGIATGLVVIGERIGVNDSLQYTAIGETPNRAARLQAVAAPDAVVIDAATRQSIGRLFEVRDLGPQDLPGLTGPVPAWAVIAESGMLSRFEALHGFHLTPFIGRDEELGLLLHAGGRRSPGMATSVLISGEPGIGKSRLIATLDEQLRGQPHIRLRYFCLPHRRDTPLAPFIGQLEHAAGFARGDTPAEKLAKLRTVLVPSTSPEDTAVIADMMSLPPDDTMPRLDLSAQRRKERTFDALERQFAALAQTEPVLVLAEDIQWSDPTSRELLDHLFELYRRLPALLVLTYRPEFEAPWVGRPGVSVVNLNRLPPRETAAIAFRLASSSIPQALIDRLVARSDGVPLFIEELTRAVMEAGLKMDAMSVALVPDSFRRRCFHGWTGCRPPKPSRRSVRLSAGPSPTTWPPRSPTCRARTFEEGLEELVEAGLAFRHGEAADTIYQFKHALVQDTAYQSMLRPRRAGLHAAIVAALEQEEGRDA